MAVYASDLSAVTDFLRVLDESGFAVDLAEVYLRSDGDSDRVGTVGFDFDSGLHTFATVGS